MEKKIKRVIISIGCLALIFMTFFLYDNCKSAVLVASDGAVLYVSISPPSIPIGGSSVVKVVGYKASGTPLPDGTAVFFNCDIGSIDSQAQMENGAAYANFRSSDNRSGIANISVRSGKAEVSPESLTIAIGSSAVHTLSLTAEPQILPVGGGISTIKIIAYDESLNTLANIPITLTTDSGQLNSGGNTIYTNAGGEAKDILQTNKTAIVTAACGPVSADITISIKTNEKPTASFVSSPANPVVGQKVYFDASGSSDSDGTIVSYQWNLGDGTKVPGVSINHQYLTSGVYTVQLVVTDNDGQNDSIDKSLTISNNQSPTASFVYSPTNPTTAENVFFNASGSTDPDGNIVTYEWDFGDGTTAAGMSVNHKYVDSGTYSVSLEVTDNTGNTGNINKSITVSSNQVPIPIFIYSPMSPKTGENVYFNASGSSDPDGSIVKFQWDMGDGAIVSGEKITHRYAEPGTYNVLLEVTDNSGNTGNTSKTITVVDNQGPTASFVYSPLAPKVGDQVYFNGANSSDPDGTIKSFHWDFGDGGIGNGESVNHIYTVAGTYTAILVVFDDSGNQASSSKSITIGL
ncbi:MAG: PKD domain-containing protein [Acidobacteria bacterium]|jgi:PKD repeat protein|nr:PKD domain-containing protein [Acidobacteriota bacterium]